MFMLRIDRIHLIDLTALIHHILHMALEAEDILHMYPTNLIHHTAVIPMHIVPIQIIQVIQTHLRRHR